MWVAVRQVWPATRAAIYGGIFGHGEWLFWSEESLGRSSILHVDVAAWLQPSEATAMEMMVGQQRDGACGVVLERSARHLQQPVGNSRVLARGNQTTLNLYLLYFAIIEP